MAIKYICGNCGAETVVNEPTGTHAVTTDNSILKTVMLDMTSNKATNKETKEMVNAKYNERMEKLANAGFDVTAMNKMFGDKGLENFMDTFLKDDSVAKEIVEEGYVNNPHLHRRYITAQYYRLFGEDGKWTERYNKQYAYSYQFSMLINEWEVIGKIYESGDTEYGDERASFFPITLGYNLIKNYEHKVEKHIRRNYKKTTFKKYGEMYKLSSAYGYKGWVSTNKLFDDVIAKIDKHAYEFVTDPISFKEAARRLRKFFKSNEYIPLPYDTQKCEFFTDAFKGAGAYYSLKNMFMNNGLHGFDEDGNPLDYQQSLDDLEEKRREYKNFGWRFLGYFRQVNELNKFKWSDFVDNGYKL